LCRDRGRKCLGVGLVANNGHWRGWVHRVPCGLQDARSGV
jgi:hypothetical protein